LRQYNKVHLPLLQTASAEKVKEINSQGVGVQDMSPYSKHMLAGPSAIVQGRGTRSSAENYLNQQQRATAAAAAAASTAAYTPPPAQLQQPLGSTPAGATPHGFNLSGLQAVLEQGGQLTPNTHAQQLAAAAYLTLSPSVLTPGVADAVANATAAPRSSSEMQRRNSGAGSRGMQSRDPSPGGSKEDQLEHIKAKLHTLKEQLQTKMVSASAEKQRKIEAQVAKLEKNLLYVEQQRVSKGDYHFCAAEATLGISTGRCGQPACLTSTCSESQSQISPT
jgi:hypothetical protein